ncbi:MAG: DUF47 family protein, partial [Candidatus Kariarchaeaceae archaeon]|jgi:uncharacterized protein Yka (UPF0111/DUF47 family)
VSVISSYLSSRRQRRVLQLLQEHAGRCKAVGHTLGKISTSWSQGKEEAARINKELIHQEEKSADNLEAELIKEVAKSELPDTKLKEELITFVRILDSAAGSAKRSATNMLLLLNYPLPEQYSALIDEASKIIATIFEDIEQAVLNLDDVELVVKKSRKIDKLEHTVDGIYSDLKEGYFTIEKSFQSSAALIILDHVCRDLEGCADKGEDAIEILAEIVQRKQ